jgi:hypothetical protein
LKLKCDVLLSTYAFKFKLRRYTKSVSRDSWHRFSARKKSHGWCDFAPAAVVLDAKSGYLIDDVLTAGAYTPSLKAQLEDLPEHIAPVRAQLEHHVHDHVHSGCIGAKVSLSKAESGKVSSS